MSLAASIQKMSRDAVDGRGGGRIESVKVAIGELSAVEPDLLVYAWETLTAGGPDRGSRLLVEWCPARQFCAACGEIKPRAPGSWLRLCPDCRLPLRVEGGGELDLMEIAFDAKERGGSPP